MISRSSDSAMLLSLNRLWVASTACLSAIQAIFNALFRLGVYEHALHCFSSALLHLHYTAILVYYTISHKIWAPFRQRRVLVPALLFKASCNESNNR